MTESKSNTRIWTYQVNRLLSKEEQAQIKPELNAFVEQWAAHGASLKASAQIIYDCIFVFAVDQNHETASGCSIDSSVRFLKELGDKYNFDAFHRNTFAYLKEDKISFTTLQNSQEAIGAQVFNLTVSNLEEYQNNFILNYEDSALAKLAIDSSFKFSL